MIHAKERSREKGEGSESSRRRGCRLAGSLAALGSLRKRGREKGVGVSPITQRGKPVADLVPIQQTVALSPEDAARRMRAFAARQNGRPSVAIRELIEEGRD